MRVHTQQSHSAPACSRDSSCSDACLRAFSSNSCAVSSLRRCWHHTDGETNSVHAPPHVSLSSARQGIYDKGHTSAHDSMFVISACAVEAAQAIRTSCPQLVHTDTTVHVSRAMQTVIHTCSPACHLDLLRPSPSEAHL